MAPELRINPFSDLLAASGLPDASLLRIVVEALRPSTPDRPRLPVEVAAGVVDLLRNPESIPTPEVAMRGLRIKDDATAERSAVYASVQAAARFLADQDRTALAPFAAADANTIVTFLAALAAPRLNVRMLKPRVEPAYTAQIEFGGALRASDKAAEGLTRIADELSFHHARSERDMRLGLKRARKAARIAVRRFRKDLKAAAKAHFVDGKKGQPDRAEFDAFTVEVARLWETAARDFAEIVDPPTTAEEAPGWAASIETLDPKVLPALSWPQRLVMALRTLGRTAGPALAAAGAVPAAQLAGFDVGILALPVHLMPAGGYVGIVAAAIGLLWAGWGWLTAGRARRALAARFVGHFAEAKRQKALEDLLVDAYAEVAGRALAADKERREASFAREREVLTGIQEMAGRMSQEVWDAGTASRPGRQTARAA